MVLGIGGLCYIFTTKCLKSYKFEVSIARFVVVDFLITIVVSATLLSRRLLELLCL